MLSQLMRTIPPETRDAQAQRSIRGNAADGKRLNKQICREASRKDAPQGCRVEPARRTAALAKLFKHRVAGVMDVIAHMPIAASGFSLAATGLRV